MARNQWVLILTAALSFYGLGQIWLVQLSSYRLWAYVGASEFEAYHLVWWRSIWGVVLGPAALVFVGSIAMIWMRPDGVPSQAVWLGLALQVLLLLGTAFWWGPLMARLSEPGSGLILPLYHKLMLTHWLRVGIVTAYSILLFWMLARSLGPSGAGR
jgi:hypothetical protein